MMAPLQSLCTVLSCMMIYLTYRTDANPYLGRQHMCKPCTGPDCDEPVNPADCKYGPTRDLCGRVDCAQGPGMRCGGDNDFYGKCGEGLSCLKGCDRCVGCSSYTFECFFQSIISCPSTNLFAQRREEIQLNTRIPS